MRFNQLGRHNDVKFKVFTDTNVQRTIRFNEVLCLIRLSASSNGGTQVIQVQMVGATTQTVNIQARDLCDDPNQGLFRAFALPNPVYDSVLQKHYVSVTVSYIDPNTRLNPAVDGTNRNAIGFTANIVGGGAILAPADGGGRHYSVQATNIVGGVSSLKLPFALPCSEGPGAGPHTVTIYDADANDVFGHLEAAVYIKGTNTRMDLSGATLGTIRNDGQGEYFRVNNTAGNRVDATFNFSPIAGQKYVLEITNLYNGNTIDIGFPRRMETIYGAVRCPIGDIEMPRTVSIQPDVSINRSDIEPGESTTAAAYASVSDFPSLTDRDWPYSETAIRNAVNLVSDGNAAARPQAENYRPAEQRRLNSASTGNAQRACARLGADGTLSDRDYRQNCSTNYTHYVCGNGSTRTIANGCGAGVNYYRWRCAINGDYWAYQNAAANAGPGCGAVYDWRCWGNDAVVATQHNQPDQICTRWFCHLPSENTWNDMSNPPNQFACKIFRCSYISSNITLPRFGGNGVFSNNNLDLNSPSDPNYVFNSGGQNILQNAGCGYRCNNGAGQPAPLDNATYGYDKNCYVPPSFNISCTITSGSNTVTVNDTVTGNGNWCNGGVAVLASAPLGGVVCATMSIIQPADGTPWPGPGEANDENWSFSVSPPDTDCMRVVGKPTAKVFGGDVAAGGSFATTICENNFPNSSIVGWPGASTGYNGSYTEYGAYASGAIFGFGSSKRQNAPRGLTFANTIGSGEWYGGGFGAMPCITNHAGMKPATGMGTTSSLNASLASGSYNYNGPNISNSPTIPQGRQIIVYVDGDLRIGSNILYDRSGWATVNDIPALKVVVSGNILIAPGVAELNGVYVAQPRADGSGGHIYTCSDVSNLDSFSSCNQPLTVNGAFIAKRVILGRAWGTQRQGTTAETFRYLPELWLTEWPQGGSSNALRYDSITNLPPIL